jgi:CHAD domain-containing protein
MESWFFEPAFVYLGIKIKQIKVMKDIKKIIKKLGEVRDLLDQNLEASNMDVEHMSQRVEDMIDEIEEAGEFEFEEEEED